MSRLSIVRASMARGSMARGSMAEAGNRKSIVDASGGRGSIVGPGRGSISQSHANLGAVATGPSSLLASLLPPGTLAVATASVPVGPVSPDTPTMSDAADGKEVPMENGHRR